MTSQTPENKQFPMLAGPPITWSMAEEFYKIYSYCFGTSQSLERIAERGGFSYSEIKAVYAVYWKKLKLEEEKN